MDNNFLLKMLLIDWKDYKLPTEAKDLDLKVVDGIDDVIAVNKRYIESVKSSY